MKNKNSENPSMQSLGGKARAQKLTAQERSEIAKKAAAARHNIPKATHVGTLEIGSLSIPCAVLEDGTRVLTQQGFFEAIGRSGKPAAGRGSDVEKVAPFLDLKNLKSFVDNELADSTKPIVFNTTKGGRAYGYRADILPKVCEVYLKARDHGALLKQQLKFAKACEVIIRGLAHIGIIALVDEATGYQYERARHDLTKILKDFIREDYEKWTRTFPLEFYLEIARIKGWAPVKRGKGFIWPQVVGHYTNDFVYSRLAPGVLEELRRKNPSSEKGRKQKHHQWLTGDIGNPRLMAHLEGLKMIMRYCETWEQFVERVDKEYPKFEKTDLGFEVQVKSK